MMKAQMISVGDERERAALINPNGAASVPLMVVIQIGIRIILIKHFLHAITKLALLPWTFNFFLFEPIYTDFGNPLSSF